MVSHRWDELEVDKLRRGGKIKADQREERKGAGSSVVENTDLCTMPLSPKHNCPEILSRKVPVEILSLEVQQETYNASLKGWRLVRPRTWCVRCLSSSHCELLRSLVALLSALPAGSSKVSAEPSPLQAGQTPLPEPLPVPRVFQPPGQLGGPSLLSTHQVPQLFWECPLASHRCCVGLSHPAQVFPFAFLALPKSAPR